MRRRILFLTNPRNDAPQEDRILTDFLAHDFDLVILHPLHCLSWLDKVEGVIIRNIWPTHEYLDAWEDVKARLRDSGLPIYNPLGFNGDIEGKDYLVVLHDKGYPVIPSIDNVDDLGRLCATDGFWIKPKKSCDGIGAKRLTEAELLQASPKGYIIQPFMEFDYEPSFFFVDNKFHHALRESHRLFYNRPAAYQPEMHELAFATEFVEWSDLDYGIQRIDAIRTHDGRLLLTEIENLCPYLYLEETARLKRHDFLAAIQKSMVSAFAGDGDLEKDDELQAVGAT